ncbi:PadR family transcriptional regulator [Herbiconiux ginsengi]|uniref:DNA-binding transcriptional regulator, PadR family n=1 Tax=Herbiconiux ginsengi TaxID=381665 RepID=A0A1H3TZ19_9MICO|nr:PadR family transcriptional regulator [Herbiconiux ginsengi]SDZ55287.1 DNA-binding transcriptional regulator, PadR family [Herbiconiux ginsengi]
MTSFTQPAYWILASLAGGRRHGYEIMRETSAASNEQVTIKATTLYAALERLERDGLVVSDGDEVVNGRARRYFRITEQGSARLAAEVDLIERSARATRSRLAAGQAASVSPRVAVV